MAESSDKTRLLLGGPLKLWLDAANIVGGILLFLWFVYVGGVFEIPPRSFQISLCLIFFWTYPAAFVMGAMAPRVIATPKRWKSFKAVFRCSLLPSLIPIVLLWMGFLSSEKDPSHAGPITSPFGGFAWFFLFVGILTLFLLAFLPNLLNDFPRKNPRFWIVFFSLLPILWLAVILINVRTGI
jgi:hypothetical protein